MRTIRPINLSKADTARFWSEVDKRGPNDCWEWTGYRNRQGYGQFYSCTHTPYLTNRVAYVVTNGDTGLLVLHTCNNPPCCNPAHLYVGTDKDNRHKCVTEDRAFDTRGENSGRAKLTESEVCEIRALYAGGWVQRKIAEKYGISQSQVSHICTGANWKHLK